MKLFLIFQSSYISQIQNSSSKKIYIAKANKQISINWYQIEREFDQSNTVKILFRQVSTNQFRFGMMELVILEKKFNKKRNVFFVLTVLNLKFQSQRKVISVHYKIKQSLSSRFKLKHNHCALAISCSKWTSDKASQQKV